ncbi:hypothetical protein Ancab_026933 [Ancistrocladus abbreviatus]
MELPKSQSVFQHIKSRELNGLRVRKRPLFSNDYPEQVQSNSEGVAIEHDGEETPPLAVSFCKTIRSAHILAVSDEDGYLSLFDTRLKLSSFATSQENAGKSRVSSWVAHQNAIFDICWIKDGAGILTASGDQTIKVWDVQEGKCTGVLIGHTGSVKSVCSHPTNSDLAVSGSRDGSFSLWDFRCKSNHGRDCIMSTAVVNRAHISARKHFRRSKAASMSITSVLYLKDEVSVATAAAVDSVVKFWDTRNLKAQVTQTCPHSESVTETKVRLHGTTSLSQDLNGVFLSASCMDNRIYLYNVLQLDKGPISSFSGCQIKSFFVKSAISPDACHVLSGSSDGNAYLWQVNKPQADPIELADHDGEVTAVDWSQDGLGKIATASDDFTVRFWNIQSSFCSSARSPSSTRKRVMAIPSSACKKLVLEREQIGLEEGPSTSCPFHEAVSETNSPELTKMREIRTPESDKKTLSTFNSKDSSEKTPESALRSPSSVLYPPSSIRRRTIRDYFLSAS